jgi:hypothetical protein
MKLSYKKYISALFILTTALIAGGCKSNKNLVTGGALTEKVNNEVIEDALKSEIDFRTLTSKGSIELKAGNSSQKVPAVFKIIKDSVLQASVRIPIIGGEAMRIDLTPDSVVIIDRIKKQYMAERYKDSEIVVGFDFNFYNLQALFTNKLFIPGNRIITNKDFDKFKISSANDTYLIQTKGKSDMSYNFEIDASDRIVSTIVNNDKKNISLRWDYSNFIKDNNYVYPTNMDAQIGFAKKQANIIISYDKLDIDKDLNVDNSIPVKYNRVGFSDIIGAYIKLK